MIGSYERANLRYVQIRQRCELHPAYFLVKFLLPREEFIDWFRRRDFPGCEVDRIDNSGHYSMGNIQLLTKNEHAEKSGLEKLQQNAPYLQNEYVCRGCHAAIPWIGMHKDNRRKEGVSNFCNSCTQMKVRNR